MNVYGKFQFALQTFRFTNPLVELIKFVKRGNTVNAIRKFASGGLLHGLFSQVTFAYHAPHAER